VIEPEASGKMTEKDFWEQYNAKPIEEQNQFYADNHHLING